MMGDPENAAQGAIIADLGANLVAIIVILLAVVSLSERGGDGSSRTFPPVLAAPLSGQDQSDILYLRLKPRADVMIVELTEGGAFVPQGSAAIPLSTVPKPWPGHLAVFVFSPRHHPTLLAEAGIQKRQLIEITVPTALHATQPQPGQSAFSPAFLAIRVGDDPASIRPELLRLLTSGPGGSALGSALLQEVETVSTFNQLVAGVHLALNIGLLLLSATVLRFLRRRFG